MIYTLKFKHSAEQKVFVYTDIHYKHNPSWPVPIWKTRGFNSSFECDAAQVENWNRKITNNDTVFLLGDTVLGAGKDSTKVFCNLLEVLNFKEIFIMSGNHYAGYKSISDREMLNDFNRFDKYLRLKITRQTLYEFGADLNKIENKSIYFIPNYYEIFVNGQAIVLSHYPQLSWNGMGKGSWHCFGHCHGNLSNREWIKNNYLVGKCLDVGIETVGSPMDFDEIKKYMDSQQTIQTDHHSGETSSPFC